jgi:hypothetical protein
MKTIIRGLIFLILIAFFSCENGFLINCPDCLSEEPSDATLIIKLNTYDESSGNPVAVNIYEGNIEDNILIQSFQARESTIQHQVLLNKKYTVTATYAINGINYIAIDSATPKVKYNKSQCDNPCYIIYGERLNLKLKYERL